MAAADLGAAEWERSKITNQDLNLLKKLGITKKPKAGLLYVYGLQLHHLTPNSILHISIFITLCDFLGVQSNWALWKRIFSCRRNGSANVAYNIGVVVICASVNYFDVKLPDSVRWRKKWLYIREENHGCAEDNIPPLIFASEKILRRRSGTQKLPRKKELRQRTRVQPLQARKNPLWNYAGDEDTDRLSTNLEVKDLDRLIRKISSLKKKDSIPSTYRVKPYSATNALPKEPVDLEIMDSDEKEDVSEATASAQSPPAVSPKNKRKRNDAEESGTSKADEAVPSRQKAAYDPYLETLIMMMKKKYQLLMWLLERPMIKELLRIGAQFVAYRDYANKTEEKLAEANGRADTLAQKLEQCEEARKKAESDAVQARREADKAKADAASVEDVRKRLHAAETSLSEHITAQSAREAAVTKRIRIQNRRFVNRTSQEFELEDPDNDSLTPFHSLNFMGRKRVKAWMKPGLGCEAFSLLLPEERGARDFPWSCQVL
ncbi:hypothetical protein QYE76_048290 [Lolium multiflorum]|uniref:Transposase (putative) gypsy type domain-containing protein n=1 Tax=Lolium multiflorum TaxID=4521 RepID=A0AAD8PH97_LOLMU|nr:hypothetical protein QYE76_048290 [Lolium multiflorum]